MKRTYVFREGGFVDSKTGEAMEIPERDGLCVPLAVIHDHEPYQSRVVPNMAVGGRAARREEIARAADKGLVPFERVNGSPGGLINDTWAKKRGLKTNEAAKDWAAKKRQAQAVKTTAEGALVVE